MPSATNRITITDLLDALQANLPNLQPGTDYLLGDLVGAEFWYSMSTGTRKHLGVEFKALVQGGDQPVRWIRRKSNNSQVYQLK
jgi:Domain of unknown function (DUF1413)